MDDDDDDDAAEAMVQAIQDDDGSSVWLGDMTTMETGPVPSALGVRRRRVTGTVMRGDVSQLFDDHVQRIQDVLVRRSEAAAETVAETVADAVVEEAVAKAAEVFKNAWAVVVAETVPRAEEWAAAAVERAAAAAAAAVERKAVAVAAAAEAAEEAEAAAAAEAAEAAAMAEMARGPVYDDESYDMDAEVAYEDAARDDVVGRHDDGGVDWASLESATMEADAAAATTTTTDTDAAATTTTTTTTTDADDDEGMWDTPWQAGDAVHRVDAPLTVAAEVAALRVGVTEPFCTFSCNVCSSERDEALCQVSVSCCGAVCCGSCIFKVVMGDSSTCVHCRAPINELTHVATGRLHQVD